MFQRSEYFIKHVISSDRVQPRGLRFLFASLYNVGVFLYKTKKLLEVLLHSNKQLHVISGYFFLVGVVYLLFFSIVGFDLKRGKLKIHLHHMLPRARPWPTQLPQARSKPLVGCLGGHLDPAEVVKVPAGGGGGVSPRRLAT